MTRAVILDFESQSLGDLKRVGGRNYWAHPSTRALCCAWHDVMSGDAGVWLHGDPQPQATVDAVCIAHNAFGFDRFGAERLGWRVLEWVDSMHLACRLGYAGSLNALGGGKDTAASRYTTSLSTPRRPPAIPSNVWRTYDMQWKRIHGELLALERIDMQRVVGYCRSDVAILAGYWRELASALSIDAETEAVSVAVNDRGVAFDTQLAKRLLICIDENTARAVDAAAAYVPAAHAVASSPTQYAAFTGAPNAQAATVESHMQHPDPAIRALANARQHVASIARGKLLAGLARVSPDGRLRDTHQYYGAHTGRWSGRGMQLQNMPRPAMKLTGDDIERLADEVLGGRLATPNEVDVLLRACITARPGHMLAVCDYSSIEARGLAWLAHDGVALNVFRAGRDPYRNVAATMFGCDYDDVTAEQRQLGKVVELACGYGMGHRKFAETTGADGSLVARWREARPRVGALWRDLEEAWTRGAALGPVRFERDGANMRLLLPSGRPIYYRDVPAERPWHSPAAEPRNAMQYRGTRFPVEHTYGGKLTENAVQAMCRDLLADALVRVEAAGLHPVMHVHDEIVCEVPAADGLDALQEIMTDTPSWAKRLPVAAEGYVARRYRK